MSRTRRSGSSPAMRSIVRYGAPQSRDQCRAMDPGSAAHCARRVARLAQHPGKERYRESSETIQSFPGSPEITQKRGLVLIAMRARIRPIHLALFFDRISKSTPIKSEFACADPGVRDLICVRQVTATAAFRVGTTMPGTFLDNIGSTKDFERGLTQFFPLHQ